MPQIFKILLIFFGVLLVHFCLMYFARPSHSSRAMKLIVDTDVGSDDAVALLLALAVPDLVNVLAVTCTYGNTKEANVQTNVLKVLTVAGRSDVPVYAGAERPLLRNYSAGDFYGKDGLGDFEFGRRIEGGVERGRHAALAMIEIVREYPGEVSIVTLGPLTNLALAIKLDQDFTKNVKRLYVMGSLINENGTNSTDQEDEFNFSLDPEANAIFLNARTKATSLILPYDVVHKNRIDKEWRKKVLGTLNSDRIQFLNKAEYATLERLGIWYAADSMTVAALIWPELITSSFEARMLPSSTCGPNKGAVEVDHEGVKNVEVVRDIDLESFKDRLLRHFA